MPSASASVVELADDWLTAKRALESAAQAEKGHSDRARRADLERWAVVLGEARGHSPTVDRPPLARLVLDDLSEEVMLAAVAAAKRRWSDATVARMLSTLRGFTRWLHWTGHLSADPLDGDLFRAPPRPERRPKSPDAEDIQRMLSAAMEEPSSRQRMFWPTRDAALLRFLATTGARAEEACGVTIGDLDRRAERPIWRLDRRAARPETSPFPEPQSMPSMTGLPSVSSPASDGAPSRRGEPTRCSCVPMGHPSPPRPSTGWCGGLPTGRAWSYLKGRPPMLSATTTASPWRCAASPSQSSPSSWVTLIPGRPPSTPPWLPPSSSPALDDAGLLE